MKGFRMSCGTLRKLLERFTLFFVCGMGWLQRLIELCNIPPSFSMNKTHVSFTCGNNKATWLQFAFYNINNRYFLKSSVHMLFKHNIVTLTTKWTKNSWGGAILNRQGYTHECTKRVVILTLPYYVCMCYTNYNSYLCACRRTFQKYTTFVLV